MFNKKVIVAVIGAAVLSGCAGVEKVMKDSDNLEKRALRDINLAEVVPAKENVENKAYPVNFIKSKRAWVNPRAIAKSKETSSVPKFLQEKAYGVDYPGVTPLNEVIADLERKVGISISINRDVFVPNKPSKDGASTSTSTSTSSSAAPASGSGTAGDSQASANDSIATMTSLTSKIQLVDFTCNDNVVNCLDKLTNAVGISWKWDNNKVILYRYETKTYYISALSQKTTTKSSVSPSSANAGGESSVNNDTSIDQWVEIKKFLGAKLSDEGNFIPMETMGMVSVSDYPYIIKKLDDDVSGLNDVLTKQVQLNVDVYTVTTTDTDGYGINFNGVWAPLQPIGAAAGNNLAIATAGATVANAGQVSFNVLKGPFATSKMILSALSTVGKSALENNIVLSTLNGHPIPYLVNKDVEYIKSIKVTAQQGSNNVSTELQDAIASQGIGFKFLPQIQPNGNVLLDISISMKDHEGFTPFRTKDGTELSLATRNLKSTSQQAIIHVGNTLLLSGFKQVRNVGLKEGVGNVNFPLFGGGANGSRIAQYVVIAVTPYVANSTAGF